MAETESQDHIETPLQRTGPDFLSAFLSYLIPGLGQIIQGRISKGLLFFLCLWGLFFYGLYLGNWQNVYFPPRAVPNHGDISMRFPPPFNKIPHAPYWGQFCIGVAAWPALIQANGYDITDPDKEHPWLGKFQRYPDHRVQEETLRNNDKVIDLGWVYTIIAGLLNILVIYDALAGPAHGIHPIRLTSMLVFLLGLTVVCAIGYVVVAGLTVNGTLHPTIYLQLPVVLALVSLVYSATRFDLWKPIVLEAVHWGWRMAMFLLVIGGTLFVVAWGIAGR